MNRNTLGTSVQEMAQMLGEGESLLVPNTSFDVASPPSPQKFHSHKLKAPLQSYQIPTDYKTLLSIAWNIEYCITEIKYDNLFSIAQQEYEKLMQTVMSETAAHRAQLGSKITAMRNAPAKGHNRAAAKMEGEKPKRINHKGNGLNSCKLFSGNFVLCLFVYS